VYWKGRFFWIILEAHQVCRLVHLYAPKGVGKLTDCICSHDSCRVWQPWHCMNGHDGAKSTHVLGPGKLCRRVWAHIPNTHVTAISGVGASDLVIWMCLPSSRYLQNGAKVTMVDESLCKLLRKWRQRGLWRDVPIMGRRHQCLISSQFQVWYSFGTWEVRDLTMMGRRHQCLISSQFPSLI
jgi:hypothetical protein